jgi:hypothetical protein
LNETQNVDLTVEKKQELKAEKEKYSIRKEKN